MAGERLKAEALAFSIRLCVPSGADGTLSVYSGGGVYSNTRWVRDFALLEDFSVSCAQLGERCIFSSYRRRYRPAPMISVFTRLRICRHMHSPCGSPSVPSWQHVAHSYEERSLDTATIIRKIARFLALPHPDDQVHAPMAVGI